MPEIVDAPAVGDRRPTESALERGGVQLVARRCDAQQASCSRFSRSSRTIGSTRSATGTRRVLPDLVPLVATPSGSVRWTINIGIGSSMSRAPGLPVAQTSADKAAPGWVHGLFQIIQNDGLAAPQGFLHCDGHLKRV